MMILDDFYLYDTMVQGVSLCTYNGAKWNYDPEILMTPGATPSETRNRRGD